MATPYGRAVLGFSGLPKSRGFKCERWSCSNTSFNVQGQPIVRTPVQAVSTFLDARLDFLAIDQMIVTRIEADEE